MRGQPGARGVGALRRIPVLSVCVPGAPVGTVVEPDADDIDWDVPVVASQEDLDFTPLPPAAIYQPFAVDDLVHHNTLGHGLVIGVETSVVAVRFFSDGAVRRLMPQYAPMHKTGVFDADNDIPF